MLARVGLKFVVNFAVTGFSLLNRLLGTDMRESQFAIAQKGQIALLAEKRNKQNYCDNQKHEQERKHRCQAHPAGGEGAPACGHKQGGAENRNCAKRDENRSASLETEPNAAWARYGP